MEINWEVIVKSGWEYKDDETKLINYFIDVAKKYPNTARAKFELANTYDFLGFENKAIPLYEDALNIGLSNEYEAYALLQLGSSLRNVGRVVDAINVLSDAEARFPELPSISMFLGMALFDGNKQSKALKTVLNAMLKNIRTSDMKRYEQGLENYKNNLV